MEKHDPISTSDHQASRHGSEAAAEAPAPTWTPTEPNWWTPYQHSLTELVPGSWELERIHPDSLQLHHVLQYFWNKCDPLPLHSANLSPHFSTEASFRGFCCSTMLVKWAHWPLMMVVSQREACWTLPIAAHLPFLVLSSRGVICELVPSTRNMHLPALIPSLQQCLTFHTH